MLRRGNSKTGGNRLCSMLNALWSKVRPRAVWEALYKLI